MVWWVMVVEEFLGCFVCPGIALGHEPYLQSKTKAGTVNHLVSFHRSSKIREKSVMTQYSNVSITSTIYSFIHILSSSPL